MATGRGRVYLVGAGPGDPGLITVRGLRLVESADAVLHDRLVDGALVERARPGAEVVDVGKAPGREGPDQEEIQRRLVELAQQGKTVVRLKGGDPFLFGRGGEEAEALARAGVGFEVVPGVSSAVAAPAYAGIPVTDRRLASSVAVATGNEDPSRDGAGVRWAALAQAVDTLVVMMGLANLERIVAELLRGGLPGDTPAALVERGTEPFQRTVEGTLEEIAGKASAGGLRPPVVAVIGRVASLRERLAWAEARPLSGRRVLVTRARHQAAPMAELLRQEGAEVVSLPAIDVEPVAGGGGGEALVPAGGYEWIVLTSANGVEEMFRRLYEQGLDARALAGAGVCAIGPATAGALRERGVRADVVPGRYVAEGLLEAMLPRLRQGDRVLLPRAESARPELAEGLRAAGAVVEERVLYRAAVPREVPGDGLALLRRGDADLATFTSSSTVANLVALLDGEVECLRRTRIACIGPVTAGTVGELVGREPDVVAREHTVPGLVRAIREAACSGALS